ncbi:MAG: pantetheine-phosphate adenylyltransferase [Candidatus Puniceispirillaceae bacterium]
MAERIAIYPGTFDPLTLGHLDILQRAASVCDHLIVGVAENSGKNPLFSTKERINIVTEVIDNEIKNGNINGKISVKGFDRLLVDFAKEEGASIIIRGLRAVSDFEYEFQMASANKRLQQDVETLFLMAAEQQHFVASRLVKEVAHYGGDVSRFVPSSVARAIMEKLGK